MECCTKQLIMRIVQMLGLGGFGSCNEDQLLGFIKAIAVRGVYKEMHRAAFQSMHQQQGKLYQSYVAKLKPKAEVYQYMMVAHCVRMTCATVHDTKGSFTTET